MALTALLGGLASADARDFYQQLIQPEWAPPGWLFGPVWTALYLMMVVAVWRVWAVHGWAGAPVALTLFLVQLVLNALWSWLFFAWHLGGGAFICIVALLVLILATIVTFWRCSRFASVLLWPYLVWVAFASVLNFTVWQLNPELLG